ncbi:MAG: DEAD/DEAH box helicase [Bacteroidia bacterium]
MTFKNLKLSEPIIKALENIGHTKPTPIQQQAIEAILDGKDIFGCAQTGTGKTGAFALPILEKLSKQKNNINPTVLILAPTRELVIQIGESVKAYSTFLKTKHVCIYGGVSQKNQEKTLNGGVDIIIATPGRLLDLISQNILSLNKVGYFVLDEADRMLDMGFINDINKILRFIPKQRQTLFFSATASKPIMKLANSILVEPVNISVTPVSSTTSLVEQSVYYVSKENKRSLLKHILITDNVDHALIFTRTKRGADRVAKDLNKSGIISESIHGDKSQGARERALRGFKSRKIKILVATDIASRGIDVDKLSHVINYEIPEQAETYVHRIGRTGRAGETGVALSFCAKDEVSYMKDINKLIKLSIPVVTTHPFA